VLNPDLFIRKLRSEKSMRVINFNKLLGKSGRGDSFNI